MVDFVVVPRPAIFWKHGQCQNWLKGREYGELIMFDETKIRSIATLCAPAPVAPTLQQQQPRVWSLTQVGSGIIGAKTCTLACCIDRHSDAMGYFKGETVNPVVGEVQNRPEVASLLRRLEFRAALTVDNKTGLVYRKLPLDFGGKVNTWTASAEPAMFAWVENCGRVLADHGTGEYRFERLDAPSSRSDQIPDVDDLIEELLADYVIETLDHPTVQRLLIQTTPPVPPRYGTPAVIISDEDDNEVY